METSRYGLAIPLGTGLTIEIMIDCRACAAWATAVDSHYQEVVPVAMDLLAVADMILYTHFMEPSVADLPPDGVRHYGVPKGWAPSGWRDTFGARIREQWGLAEEVTPTLAA